MCDKKVAVRCDVCRTINLAKDVRFPKADMVKYGKCTPTMEPDCGQFTGKVYHRHTKLC